MGVDFNKLNYYSGVNYMKRLISDSTSVGASQKSVSHNLAYIPQFVYYADLFSDGMLWYGGECVNEYTDSTSGGGTLNPQMDSWISTSSITFYPSFYTGSRTAYFVIYRDYGGTQ